MLKDFNIAKEAGGVGKAVMKNFTAVVNSSTLEIRLYWAGKGTTAIPFRSVYGPLISAISVDPGGFYLCFGSNNSPVFPLSSKLKCKALLI